MKNGKKVRGLLKGVLVVFALSFAFFSPLQAEACAGCRACEMGTACGCGCKMAESTMTQATYAEETTVDPVCGMKVNPADSERKGLVYEWKGKKYYFCTKGDLEKFKASPEKYLSGKGMMHHETSGEKHRDVCSKMESTHEAMMKAYAEVKEAHAKLKSKRSDRVVNEFYAGAKAFMNSMHEMHMLMGDEGMKMMKSHHRDLIRAFESLKEARKKLNSALTASQRKKAWPTFIRSADVFASEMDKAHDMAMKHMGQMKGCGGGSGMMKKHGHH